MPPRKSGGIPQLSTRFSLGLPNPSRETKFSGTNRDKEISIFPVQLTTTSRIGNLTRLIHTILSIIISDVDNHIFEVLL